MENTISRKKNNDWELVIKDDIKYIESKLLLKYGFKHAFFTKESNNFKPEEILKYFNGSSTIHKVKQVHGNKVIHASKSLSNENISADGLISDKVNQGLWVYSADCIPLLFADPLNGFVAASHAGWKGLSKNIIKETINEMEKLGCERPKIVVALGPCISMKNYEVGEELITEISKTLDLNGYSIKKTISNMNKLGIANIDRGSNMMYLDIRIAAYYQLIKEGLLTDRISISPYCTFSNYKLFNSWRRENKKLLQWSCIISDKYK